MLAAEAEVEAAASSSVSTDAVEALVDAREGSKADRKRAGGDRRSAAGDRTHAEADRGASAEDRAAATVDRAASYGEEAQARLASIVRASSDAILAKTLDGIVTTWNRGAEVLFGYRASEIIGDSIDVLVPAEGREEEAALRQRVALGLGVEQYETVRLRQDGTAVDVSVTLSPIEDAGGRVTGIATICRDITDRKRVETALLEREAELATARDQAVEASRLKSEFLTNMSHEIRTPMNAVIGLTGLLLDSSLGTDQREYAGAVRSAGEALLDIINDILDFSKIEAGKLRLEVMDFDPRTVVEEVADLLGTKAHEKGLELVTLVNPDVPQLVRGDPGRLRQVLTNLVGNAVKFSDAGEVVVRVRAEGQAPEATTLRFEVADTGMGISPQDQQQLFRAFEQVDASASRHHGDTGLGLVISKQLVEMMGGEIGVKSSLGVGSTFWFSAAFLAAEGPPQRVIRRRDLQGLRILVVDDNATNRAIVEHRVFSWGMVPTQAGSGQEALDAVRAARDHGEAFDVAILDSVMPGMDGHSLAAAINADDTVAAMPLVMMTSGGSHGPGANERSAFVAYLSKPVHEGDLYDSLTRATGRVAMAVEAAPVPEPAGQERRHRARLLVAEDNALNQLVAVRMLERLGYQADVASNGSEAIDAVALIDYACVLMDCHMPEMDGYQATQEIRRRQFPTRRTPVIAMTASATQENRDRCLGADMDDFIAKPVRRDELEVVLARWIPAGISSPESDAEIGVD